MRKRLTVSLLIGLIALLISAMPVSAGLVWCQGDPIVRLNGTETNIIVEIPEQYQGMINGPIEVTITTQRGVERELIFTDSGFNGYGEQVEFAEFPFELPVPFVLTHVAVSVPIDEDQLADGEHVPARLTVAPANGNSITVTGTADRTEALARITIAR